MPPRLQCLPMRQLAVRTRKPVTAQRWATATHRAYSSSQSNDPTLNPNPKAKPQTDPSHSKSKDGSTIHEMPHITEEAAAMSKATGHAGPELSQGTPVGEVVGDDKAAKKNLPKVMQDALKQQKRSFSTSTRRRLEVSAQPPPSADMPPLSADFSQLPPARNVEQLQDYRKYSIDDETARMIATGELPDPGWARRHAVLAERRGLKHPYPEGPVPKLPRAVNLRTEKSRRKQDCVTQVTNLIMRDGKKSVAQRNMSIILSQLRTSPSPNFNPSRPLLPDAFGTPLLAESLSLNPALYLQVAIDSVAPLMRIRSMRGGMGGGVAMQLPIPLPLRQRRRTAISWILDAVKRRSGGTSPFAKRFAEEIHAIAEGRSAVWEKRTAIHKQSTLARTNLAAQSKQKKSFKKAK